MPVDSTNVILLPKLCSFLFIILLALGSAYGQQSPKTKYTITGYTLQKEGKARLLLYTNRSQFIPYDSTSIKNGAFTFSGTLDEPKSFQLLIGNKSRILFVGNEHIVVNDRNDKTGEITITGSKLSNDYDYYFNRWLVPLISRLQKVNERLDSLDTTHQKEIDSLTLLQSSLFAHVPDSSVVFIRQKPASFVSLYLLNYYADAYNAATVARLFAHLDASLKQYPSADFIRQKIQLGSQVSAKCPSFSVEDKQGQLITLQSFKGNYLLIDFWASWCVPCVTSLPFVQKAADRFQHQNFKVLTASLDNDTTAWKSALEKYHLTDSYCQNVFLPNQFRNSMALQFQVASIPRTILVDPDGNIIENNIEGEKLGSRLEKIFTVSADGSDDVALSQFRTLPKSISILYRY